jgi:polar amino acid transport system substrate-binding protein
MMTSRSLRLLWLCMGVFALPAHALTFLTEDNPPFNYVENGQVEGLATALIQEMTKRASLPATFELVAWEDGYQRAQRDRETCLYATARVESREKLFHWIGPLAVNRWGVFGKSDFPGTAKRIEDLRKFRVGGVTNDAKLEYLAQYAVTNIRSVPDDRRNPPRLKLPKDDPDRIDLWITGAYTARKVSRENGGPALKTVYLAQEIPLYLACSPATSRSSVKLLDDALKAMRRDGTAKKITNRYLGKFAR